MHGQLSKYDYSILLANCIDRFDTALYGFLAPILAPIFFPSEDPLISLILAYSVFATSIITKPLGTYIFSVVARTYGAHVSLGYSLIGVAIFTMIMGIIPTYDKIGFWAAGLLVLTRTFRDIFAAGEIAISKLYIVEEKSNKLAFRSSYLYQTSTMMGIVFASLLSTIIISLEADNMWRICFLIGGIGAVFGIILRNYGRDVSRSRRELLKNSTIGVFSSLWNNKNTVFKIGGAYAFSYMIYSVAFILINTLIPLITDLELADMMKINTSLLVFDLLCLPLMGFALENFKAKTVMLTASIILTISIVPLWALLKDASFEYVVFFRIWLVFWGVVFACPFNLWCSEQVNSDDKFIIVGFAGALGSGAVGKMTPAISLYMLHTTGNYLTVAVYLCAVMTVAAVAIYYSKTKN